MLQNLKKFATSLSTVVGGKSLASLYLPHCGVVKFIIVQLLVLLPSRECALWRCEVYYSTIAGSPSLKGMCPLIETHPLIFHTVAL
jgi:hypothetical protein